jgi:heme exporter protein B
MTVLRQVLGILRKDLLLDWRGQRRVGSTFLFGVITLLLFSFAVGPDSEALARHAAGYLWLALVLSSTLALNESFRVEIEDDALEGLSLLPVDPRALFYGKAIANLLFLALLCAPLVPMAMVMYGVTPVGGVGTLVLLLFVGIAGLAGPGTLYAAMAARARGRDAMLPLLLFPLVIPIVLASVKATHLVFFGDPMDQLSGWLRLSVAFDVIYWSLGGLLFGKVIDA